MMDGQGREEAIHPEREEGGIGVLEVEGDGEVIRRNVCSADQVEALGSESTELGVEQELPAVVHVAGIIRLPIRPDQTGSQMEGPGGGVGADAAILHCGDFPRRPWMNDALRVAVEERQVERLV